MALYPIDNIPLTTIRRLEEIGAIEDIKKEKTYSPEQIARFEFLQHIVGNKKDKDKATEFLVNYILERNKIYTTKDDEKSEMWIYEEGIYLPNGKSSIKEQLRKVLGNAYNQFHVNLVIAKIEADTFISQETFFSNNYVYELPLLNGILNLKDRSLSPFNPEKIFFNKLPVAYDILASCPQIDKFLSDVLAKEDDAKLFHEIGGFCLWKENFLEKAFIFVGSGRNGKDKSLELIKRILGIDNCISVPLSMLDSKSFIVSEFFNKMGNLAGEIDNKDLTDTKQFKELTGRSMVTAQRKFLKPIKFMCYTKFIFACNNLPMVYDTSKGFWERWEIMQFPYTFQTQQEIDNAKDKTNLKLKDTDIIEKITTPSELSGLLNRFLEGLDRIHKEKSFSCTIGSDAVKRFWITKSNSVMAFCLENIEADNEGKVLKKVFRKRYSDFCKKNNVGIRSDKVIYKTLEEMFGCSEGRQFVKNENGFLEQEHCWEGIKLKDTF
jgi:putative DNA primase/helicase